MWASILYLQGRFSITGSIPYILVYMVPTHHGLLYGKCMSMAGHHVCNAIWINFKIIIIHKSHWLCIYTSSYQRWFTNILLYSQNLVSIHSPIFYPSNILPHMIFTCNVTEPCTGYNDRIRPIMKPVTHQKYMNSSLTGFSSWITRSIITIRKWAVVQEITTQVAGI